MSTPLLIADIVQFLNQYAPPELQESYDNAGLICGNPNTVCTGALLCLDSTEAVVEEAIQKGFNLIVAHHPIVFKGLKRLNGSNYVERVIIKAIQNNIAIFAAHTNLDNVQKGVNAKICEKIGIQNAKILAPKNGLLQKLYTFCPSNEAKKLRQVLFAAGAGEIGNYDHCSYNTEGFGTFRANDNAQPFVGEKNSAHQETETKIEVIFPSLLQKSVVKALIAAHPYEEPAFDIVALENTWQQVGSGMVGTLPKAMEGKEFLQHLKASMQVACIRHTQILPKKIATVAVCGGAGSFLLRQAIAAKADVFITGDFKYHEFFDAENHLMIADIGHYESEQFTIDLFFDIIRKKFANFAVQKTSICTNPVHYFV
ncbi:MAG: Nif3-like dinuclear metal center hexameric protein [Chitinophagales bacterium]|nr:Nif3-like dinuclear metal center hexameric protein [Bacteroidota bacterium]